MRRFIAAVLVVTSILPIGCKSKEEREREQLDREQTQMMEKLLAAEAEQQAHDGSAPAPHVTAVDAGAH